MVTEGWREELAGVDGVLQTPDPGWIGVNHEAEHVGKTTLRTTSRRRGDATRQKGGLDRSPPRLGRSDSGLIIGRPRVALPFRSPPRGAIGRTLFVMTLLAIYSCSGILTANAGVCNGSWANSTPEKVGIPGANDLSSIAGISHTDVWAVGSLDSGREALVENYDGTAWHVKQAPTPGSLSWLQGVSASSSSDVWAVGSYVPYGSGSGGHSTLTEHFDGTTWRQVASPNVSRYNELQSVVDYSPSDVWAVGFG